MPFREMRRKKQALSIEESIAILERGTTGFLAVHGDDGYPYVVPLNYAYIEGALYIHCAKHGHKVDAIAKDPKVSFCVVDRDEVMPELFATSYRSVIAFGRAQLLEGEDEKRTFIELLGRKYNPTDEEGLQREIEMDFSRLAMIKIDIEHLTGKASLDLSR